MRIFNVLRKLFLGNYKLAIKEGLNVGENVVIIGGANFGSEPYLITLEDEVKLSSNVKFITHDCGTWSFLDDPKYSDVIKYGKIRVVKRSFIGTESIIMPGVTIGKRCVIGERREFVV